MANRSGWWRLVENSRMAAAFVLVLLSFTKSNADPVAITPGNLVLTRVAGGAGGNASVALSGANKVFLDEYTTAGVFVQSIPVNSTLATSGQRAATLAGTANTEGHITLSQDGNYMVYAGYNQTELVAGPNSSASNVVERVIARLELSTGAVDTSTAFIDAMSAQSVRSAYTTNGTDMWITGSGGNNVTINTVSQPTAGVHYGQFGLNNAGSTTLSTQLNTSGLTANNRMVLAFGGNLYVSSGNTSSTGPALSRGVDIMSGGVATTTGQLLSSLPGFPTAAGPAPDDFWFFNDNTIFLADQRTNGIDGGIQKWTLSAGTWSLQYTLGNLGTVKLTTIGGTAAGVHGLTGVIDGATGNAILYGTTFDGTGANQSKFFSITDTGATSDVNYLGTSVLNSAFRGIEIAQLPPISVPEAGVFIAWIAMGGLTCAANLRRRP